MSDWQAGDLALCVSKQPIHHSWFNPSLARLRVGAVYTVEKVGLELGAAVLLLQEVRSDHPEGSFQAARFRKVTPPAADEFDRETIALMNGVRVGEPA